MTTSLSFRQLRYLCAVAQEGSILAAAKQVCISHSSILAAIDLAEHEIKASLFERTPSRGVIVTPAGQRFMAAARVLIAAEAEFSRSVNALATQSPTSLRVGCFEPFGPLFMADVLKCYSDELGPTEIALLEGDQTQLQQWLRNGSIDLAVTYDIGMDFGDSSTRICSVPPHALIHAGSPLAYKRSIALGDLVSEPLVLLDLPQTVSYLLTLFQLHGLQPLVGLRTRSYDTVRAAVAAGLGYSVLNMKPLGRSGLDGPDLLRKPLSDKLPSPNLIVADVYGTKKPHFVTQFIDVCSRFFGASGLEKSSSRNKGRAAKASADRARARGLT